jgi:Tol biopolymer transport system component
LNIWLRGLATGRETQLARSALVQRSPVINASGTRIAFLGYENGKRFVFMSTPGGVPRYYVKDVCGLRTGHAMESRC